jgi:hypothetical protein
MHADANSSDFTIVGIGNMFLGLIAAWCGGNIDVQYGHDDRYAWAGAGELGPQNHRII